jgi:nitrogen fixation protein NifB
VAKIGRCPRESLAEAGIEAVDRHAFQPIEAAAVAWLAEHAAQVARGETRRETRPEAGSEPVQKVA